MTDIIHKQLGFVKKLNIIKSHKYISYYNIHEFDKKQLKNTNDIYCTVGFNIPYFILQYNNDLQCYIISDIYNNTYVKNFNIFPLQCKIIFYMINNTLILSDVIEYDGINLMDLTMYERYKYLEKITIDTIDYDIIEIFNINTFSYFIKEYLNKIPYHKNIDKILLNINTHNIMKWNINIHM